MLSHAGSQYPISSYNESRNSPLRPLDKSMSYHELSEKRSAFLEKIKNIVGHGKGKNYETLRAAYVNTMEKEKQRQEQKRKEKQKDLERQERQNRRKTIIEGNTHTVSLEDMALLDSPFLPKDTPNTNEDSKTSVRRHDTLKTMKLPKVITKKSTAKLPSRFTFDEPPLNANAEGEKVMSRLLQHTEKNQKLYFQYDQRGKVTLTRDDPEKGAYDNQSLFNAYFREIQQDEINTKIAKMKRVDPLLEVYQKRRVQSLKQKAQAVIPIPEELEKHVNNQMMMSESIRELIIASKSFTKDNSKEYSLILPPIHTSRNQSLYMSPKIDAQTLPTETSGNGTEDALAFEWNDYYKVDLDVRPYLDPNDEFFETKPEESHFDRNIEGSLSGAHLRLSVAQNRKKLEKKLQAKYQSFDRLAGLMDARSARQELILSQSVTEPSAIRSSKTSRASLTKLISPNSNAQPSEADSNEDKARIPRRRFAPSHSFRAPKETTNKKEGPKNEPSALDLSPKVQEFEASDSKTHNAELRKMTLGENIHVEAGQYEAHDGSSKKLRRPSHFSGLHAETLDQIQKTNDSVESSSSGSAIDLSHFIRFAAAADSGKENKKAEIPFKNTPMDKLKKKIISLAVQHGSNNIALAKGQGKVNVAAVSERAQETKAQGKELSRTRKMKDLVEEKVKLLEIKLEERKGKKLSKEDKLELKKRFKKLKEEFDAFHSNP